MVQKIKTPQIHFLLKPRATKQIVTLLKMSASSFIKRSQRVGSVHLGSESAFLLFWSDMNSHDLTKSCLKVPDLPLPARRQLTVHVSVGAAAVFYQHVNKNFLLAGRQVQHGLLAKSLLSCWWKTHINWPVHGRVLTLVQQIILWWGSPLCEANFSFLPAMISSDKSPISAFN